jgi:hypothetical protein
MAMVSPAGDGISAEPPAPELCVRGGDACYLCGLSIVSGELALVYRDERFWDQAFLYHARCWADADLPAKSGAGASRPAPAVELPAAPCQGCRAPIESGDLVVREWVREGRGVRIYHAPCARRDDRG